MSLKNKKKYLNHFLLLLHYYTNEIHLIQTFNIQFIDPLNHTIPFEKQKNLQTSRFLIKPPILQ